MAISNNNTGIRTGVCTSSTRPTAPYEGQHIYETDTDIEYVWNGSAWVVTYVSANSPAFTGTPTAPTAAAGTNTTQLATTAFVQTANSGSVIQVIQGTTGTQVGPAGSTYANAGLSASITPKATSSRILVTISFAWYNSGGKGQVRINRGGTQIAQTNSLGTDSGNPSAFSSLTFLDSPSTTSATTYTVQYRADSGGFYFAHTSNTNTIVLMEIAG